MNDIRYQQEIDELLSFLRPAFEQWRQGNPMGYAELLSDEATYFDPRTDEPITGREEVIEHFQPIVGLVQVPIMEPSNIKLQRIGDYRIFCCNWNEFDDQGRPMNTWNSSEVWAQHDGHWQIIHTHWSIKLENT